MFKSNGLVTLLLLICTGCLLASPQGKIPSAIAAEKAGGAPPSNLQGRGVRRIRAVRIGIDLFNETAAEAFRQQKRRKQDFIQRVQMNFFPNVHVTVAWSQLEPTQKPAGLLWTGKVVGAPSSQATLVISGKNVTANINRGDGHIYQIRTAEDGRWWVREVDQAGLPKESEPVIPNR